MRLRCAHKDGASCDRASLSSVIAPRRAGGFTLLEILIVLVIMGIVVAMVSLSINILGRDTQIEDQATRLEKVLAQVREESEMQGRDVGLFVERDGYLFMRFDMKSQSWMEIQDDDMMSYRVLPPGLENRLWLEGREVILKTHEENSELAGRVSASSSSQSSSTLNSSDSNDTKGRVPQIAILSSGDIAPFELRIAREGNDFSWHVLGKPDNTIVAEITDAQH